VNFDIQSSVDELKHSKAQVMTECNEVDQNSNIGDWVDDQVANAKKIQREGKELNPFFLPEFVNMLALRAKEFPLWTNVGIDYGTSHATSSYVESYFNDIKTRILKTGSMRVDKFLIKHAHDIQGATLLFSSGMINFNAKRYVQNTDPIEKEKESKINKSHKRSYKLHSTPKNTEKNESTSKNQRKFNIELCAKLKIEPNNEEKTYFHQSLSNNKQDKLNKSPKQSIKLKLKSEHIEDILCPDKRSNDIKVYSCEIFLLLKIAKKKLK